MCGILGLVSNKIDKKKLQSSLEMLNHRGPDASKLIINSNVALGHTRLSIQDLSQNGNQPMLDKESGNWIIFNGEIYNYKKIREDLIKKGITFSSKSDTEVILKLYNLHGINETLKNLEGMYSFAIFDSKKNKILLCRDRFGMKPLFYSNISKSEIMFSSEIKPILYYKESYKINNKNVVIPMVMGMHNVGSTFFEEIHEVKSGEIIILDTSTNQLKKEVYSTCRDLIDKSYYEYLDKLPNSELVKHYDKIFRESVKMHLVSDAPTSVLYSGGIDSTLVTNYALEFNKNIECFFFNSFYSDTLPIVKKIKDNDLVNLNIYTEKKFDLFLEIPEMIYRNECIINASGAALMLVSKQARDKGIKSMLTGDAADELFGGYETHVNFYNRNFLQKNILTKNIFKILRSMVPGIQNYGDDTNNDYLSDFVNNKDNMVLPLQLLTKSNSKLSAWNANIEKYSFIKNDFEKSMQSYLLSYLENNIHRYLIRSDRAGMSRSIELRIPYLSTELVKLALNTPIRKKMAFNPLSRYPGLTKLSFLKQKIILRELAKYTKGVNTKIINRKKEGIMMNVEIAKYLIEKTGAKLLKDFFEITEKDLSFLLNQKENELILWGFLQTDVFLRIFYKKENFQDIKNDFKNKLESYKR